MSQVPPTQTDIINNSIALLNEKQDLGNHYLSSKSAFNAGVQQLLDVIQKNTTNIEDLNQQIRLLAAEKNPPKPEKNPK